MLKCKVKYANLTAVGENQGYPTLSVSFCSSAPTSKFITLY
jgi:hypothetical protein